MHLQARAKCALVDGSMLRIVNPLALQGIEIAAPDDAHPWAVACRPSIDRNRDCCTAGTARCNWSEPRHQQGDLVSHCHQLVFCTVQGCKAWQSAESTAALHLCNFASR